MVIFIIQQKSPGNLNIGLALHKSKTKCVEDAKINMYPSQ